ncbi:MAG: tetratricopeptide repeat protein [Pseudomonadota bacterium]
MTNDERAFREVDQELAEDRQMAFLRRYGPGLIGVAAAVVVAVAAQQIYAGRQLQRAEDNAVALREAALAGLDDPAGAQAAYEAFEEDAAPGYRVLSVLRRAGLAADAGDRDYAAELYRSVAAAKASPPRVRDFARLRAAYFSLDAGRDAVLADLGELVDDKTAIGAHAREIAAFAAFQAGDYQTAQTIFERAVIDFDAPASVRQRAEEMQALASAARKGVDVSTAVSLDDLQGVLSTVPDPAGEAGACDAEVPAPIIDAVGEEAGGEAGEETAAEDAGDADDVIETVGEAADGAEEGDAAEDGNGAQSSGGEPTTENPEDDS